MGNCLGFYSDLKSSSCFSLPKHHLYPKRQVQLADHTLPIVAFYQLDEEEQFVIEFALESWYLSQKGREVIKNAAKLISESGATRVLVVGHTDQSGNPEYNVRLSRRRAKSVLEALQLENVSPAILTVDWKGEFEPTISVGDDDFEPRNRRVVIHVFK